MRKADHQLKLPYEIIEALAVIGDRENLTTLEVLRKMLKLGLIIDTVQQRGGEFVMREGETEREVILFPKED